jgi:carbonic anhydrase
MSCVTLVKALLAATCVQLASAAGAKPWDYKTNQGQNWPKLFDTCDDGPFSHQTPINIKTQEAVLDENLYPFVFSREWGHPMGNATVQNNGHTYQLNDHEATRTVRGGGLTGTYTMLQMHFHFGSQASHSGAEHFIDGKQHKAEVHFVMRNSVDFGNETFGHYAVLGFFIDHHTPTAAEVNNKGVLDSILKNVLLVKNGISENPVTTANPISLAGIPKLQGLDKFFRYTGSLTTPPCTRIVIWSLFSHPIPFTDAQYKKLLGGFGANNTEIKDTFRLLMPINDRLVMYSPGTVNISDEAFRGEQQAAPASAGVMFGMVTLGAAIVLVALLVFILIVWVMNVRKSKAEEKKPLNP